MIKFLPLEFIGVSHRITAFYRLQMSALVPEIFKFEKCVIYVDDVIHSTQNYIKYINRAIQQKPLKLGRLIVLQQLIYGYKNTVPMSTHFSPVPANLISIF